ncbi:MAG: GNAT family N-acetyltransferase [Coriobacteriia bacterium]|nr:GNAT family N-acetyltransferase [Coriobacteriia bacterium]
MRVERADISDAEEILTLIKRAFTPVGEQYDDPDLPPLAETLDEHRAIYARGVVLKAIEDDRIVGSVQGILQEDGCCYIARLVVEPMLQSRGIGRTLAMELEKQFPEATGFSLFTGHRSEETLGLYSSLGYVETRRERVNDTLTLVWMEKRG